MSPVLAGTVLLACALLVLVGRGLLSRAYPSGPDPCSPGTPTYRGDRLAYQPPRDGAELGYRHPLGWSVQIVRGIPVAVGPDGRAVRWSRALTTWTPCEPELAAEARSRLQMEETRVDDSLPVAEPLGAYPPVPADAPPPWPVVWTPTLKVPNGTLIQSPDGTLQFMGWRCGPNGWSVGNGDDA